MTETKRAALYCRISRDKAGGGLGVARQESDCRALAERLGAEIVAVHVDNDMSAYSGKPRPGYRDLLKQVRAGTVDVVLVWHTDRLHRSPAELEAWISAAEVHGVTVHGVKAGKLDLATPSGRMVARQLGAVARYESEHRAERVRAAKVQAVEMGKYRGGRRPYGYESNGVTVREPEAELVREMTERVLAGESLHSLARSLNERGETTSTGRPWRNLSVRDLILRARNAGLIERVDQDVRGRSEILGPASWPAIVDEARYRAARRLLTAPGRRHGHDYSDRWLGSGTYLCGRCGDVLRAARTPSSQGGERVHVGGYRCRSGTHLTCIAEPVDALIADVLIARLSRKDARLLLAPESRRVDLEALHAERAGAEARLADLASLVADGTLSAAQVRDASAGLRGTVERLDREITSAGAVSPLKGVAGAADVRAAWEAASVSRRKAILRALATVTIEPAGRGRPAGWTPGSGGYFNPDRVRIDWL